MSESDPADVAVAAAPIHQSRQPCATQLFILLRFFFCAGSIGNHFFLFLYPSAPIPIPATLLIPARTWRRVHVVEIYSYLRYSCEVTAVAAPGTAVQQYPGLLESPPPTYHCIRVRMCSGTYDMIRCDDAYSRQRVLYTWYQVPVKHTATRSTTSIWHCFLLCTTQ